ncbi:cadherin-related family member 5 [Aulostomus maculatus]
MAGTLPPFAVRIFFFFLPLILLQTCTEAQGEPCTARPSIRFDENNNVGDVVETITVMERIRLEFDPPPANPNYPFALEGNLLVAARVLDYETSNNHMAKIACIDTVTGNKEKILTIAVIVVNLNDNAPFFGSNANNATVGEFSPVGTTIGHYPATDLDPNTQLYYTLISESNDFALKSETKPEIVTRNVFDYDKVQKNVKLVLTVQDTPLTIAGNRASHTATTNIMVSILDVDNRLPWFQPCIKHEVGLTVVCQSAGYTGKVIVNEIQSGLLPLEPGPLYAFDGDSGINDPVTYSFLSGHEDGIFQINPHTGNITMLKEAKELGTITLAVAAAQTINSYQIATTSVTISVQDKSLHPPEFQRLQYQAIVSAVGTQAMDLENKDEPLRIIVLDKDYASTGNLNPNIVCRINGSSDFVIIDGFLFMTTELPETTLSLQVVAEDTTNGESAEAPLFVEVNFGVTTTALPLSTTMTSTSITEFTTNRETTKAITSTSDPSPSTSGSMSTPFSNTTSVTIVSTTHPSVSTEASVTTTSPSTTSVTIVSTTDPRVSTESSVTPTSPSTTSETMVSTSEPRVSTESSVTPTSPSTTSETMVSTMIISHGDFGAGDMAALGATLGALLLISLGVIGVLIYRVQRGKADWRKIFEASKFRSSLGHGSGSPKEGIQYTNETFQDDEDRGSLGSGGPDGGRTLAGEDKQSSEDFRMASLSGRLHTLLDDDLSQTGSDKADNEKEVKPILTKERRMEEGYKAVWFKEDIDPNAKEEVVIIPEREEESEEESEEASSSREDEDDDRPSKVSTANGSEADLDSGLGEKIEDAAGDSESDDELMAEL